MRADDSEDVSHPDLCFLRRERLALSGWQACEGVPDLVVEIISPGTRSEHRRGGKWWSTYERYGVPHYWLAFPTRRLIEQYPLIGEPYVGGHYGEPATLRPGDVLGSPLFPTVTVPVDRIFQRVQTRQPRHGVIKEEESADYDVPEAGRPSTIG
jgi:Uma2 family endonuclease